MWLSRSERSPVISEFISAPLWLCAKGRVLMCSLSLFPHVDAYVRSGLLSEWKDIANHLELIEHMAPQHNAESMIEVHRMAFRC